MEQVGKYVCVDCGNSKDAVFIKCEKCGGMRIYLRSVVTEVFGNDWQKHFTEQDLTGLKDDN